MTDLSGNNDEGIRNIGGNVYNQLVQNNEVLAIKPHSFFDFIKIIKFRPNIIHSLRGPSYSTFILLKIISYLTGCKKIYCSILHLSKSIIKNSKYLFIFNSIRLFTQDENFEKIFTNEKFIVTPLPNGIDGKIYNKQVESNIPDEIRKQIKKEKKYILHVGHLKSSRGLDIILEILKTSDWGVILIISERFKIDKSIYNNLLSARAIIYIGYLQNLETIYTFADCYLFPVNDSSGSIDMPLTILESLACGTPVLSTYFKAIPRFLNQKDGVYFYKNKKEMIEKLNVISRYKSKNFNTDFLWTNIVEHIENQYSKD